MSSITKKVFILIVSIIMLVVLGINVYANILQTKIQLDGTDIDIKKDIINIEGSTYIPLRETFEYLGFDVDWNEETNAINIIRENEQKLLSDIHTIQKGSLASGQSYVFFPINEIRDFDALQKSFDKSIMYEERRKSDLVPDIYTAVKLAKAYFYSEMENSDNIMITYNIIYDNNKGAWIVSEDFSGTVNRLPQKIIIRSCDGKVLGVSGM